METLMPDEQEMFLTQVNRLADQQLADLRLTRADRPREGWRGPWRQAALGAGLLPGPGADNDVTLWSAGMMQTSARVLRALAAHDAGAALALHREAQGWRLAGELTLDGVEVPMFCATGATGLGRRALARWLRGAEADGDDLAELEDNWAAPAPRLCWSGDWSTGLVPVWHDGALYWWCLRAGRAVTERYRHGHAFQGLLCQRLDPRHGEVLAPVSPPLMTELLVQEQLALLAIGAGVLDCALDEAAGYAGQRRQGGRLIRDWPAVQQLLADMRAVSESLDDLLALPVSADTVGLARLMRRRAALAADTTRACNQAMQVFGGLGYMRDLGVERLLREANALRLMSGSPLFLPLLAEHLEER